MKALLAMAVVLPGALLAVPVRGQGIELCRPEQVEKWKRLRRENLGVQVRDPAPNLMPDHVPPSPAPLDPICPQVVDFSLDQDGRADDGVHQWIFADACTQTVCGRPLDFESNKDFGFLSGEYDLNNNLEVPEHLKTRLRRYACFPEGEATTLLAQQYPHLCFPQIDVIHTEITPPLSLRRSLTSVWYESYPDAWQTWRDTLAEGHLCVHGPVVGDTGHAVKLEVHPAQFIWWNENRLGRQAKSIFAPDGPFNLYFIQDASARYSKRHHFVLKNPLPRNGTWRPWAAGPVEATYEIAVWAAPREKIHLEVEDHRPDQAPRPRDQPLRALLTEVEARNAEGDTAFSAIVSNGADPRHVRAELQVLCRKRAGLNPVLDPEGYLAKLVLRLTAGTDVDWHEGVVGLRVTDRRPVPALPPQETLDYAEPPKPAVLSVVTWKPAGAGWSSVNSVSAEDRATAQRIARTLFDAAGWEPSVVAALDVIPTLRRLTAIELSVEHALLGPKEKEGNRRSMKSRVSWDAPRIDGKDCQPPQVQPAGGGQRILFRDDPLTLCRLDVVSEIEPSVAFVEWAREKYKKKENPKDWEPQVSRRSWSVWSHGLKGGESGQWMAASEALWRSKIDRSCPESKVAAACAAAQAAPLPFAFPAAAPVPCPQLDRSLPRDELRILIPGMLRDGVMSVNELKGIADDLEAIAKGRCADLTVPQGDLEPTWTPIK